MMKSLHVSDAEYSSLLEKIEELIVEILKKKDRVLIAVVGKNGTGKSYFGRYVRKNGVGRFHSKTIAVIDDRVMKLEFLYFFRKSVKIPRNGVDELKPYLEALPSGKKIVFYINETPADKITQTDILLQLTTDETTRKQRLRKRYGGDPEKLERYLQKGETGDYGIQYTYFLEAHV